MGPGSFKTPTTQYEVTVSILGHRCPIDTGFTGTIVWVSGRTRHLIRSCTSCMTRVVFAQRSPSGRGESRLKNSSCEQTRVGNAAEFSPREGCQKVLIVVIVGVTTVLIVLRGREFLTPHGNHVPGVGVSERRGTGPAPSAEHAGAGYLFLGGCRE